MPEYRHTLISHVTLINHIVELYLHICGFGGHQYQGDFYSDITVAKQTFTLSVGNNLSNNASLTQYVYTLKKNINATISKILLTYSSCKEISQLNNKLRPNLWISHDWE